MNDPLQSLKLKSTCFQMIAFTVWAAVIALGIRELSHRSDLCGDLTTANSAMPTNHVISANDLNGVRASELTGMYLRQKVTKGTSIEPRDVSSTPVLGVGAKTLFAIPMPDEPVAREMIEAGVRGQVCNQANAIAAADVVAVVCDKPDDKRSCVVLASATDVEAAKVLAAMANRPTSDMLRFKLSCKDNNSPS